MLQPTTLCNLNCGYCYLPERAQRKLMAVDVAEACASSVRAQAGDHPVDVVWHGGEPTATPRAHLRRLLLPFEQLRRAGKVQHGVQTNGTLLDGAWCELFAEFGFEVGISVDGPPWANRERLDWRGKESFGRTRRGIEQLQQAGLPFTVICVVGHASIGHPEELVDFFESIGCESVGFNIEEDEGSGRSQVATSAAYEFWRGLLRARLNGSRLRIRELDRLNDFVASSHNSVQDRPVDPIPTVGYDGATVLLSPELLGVKDAAYGHFVAGNVLTTDLGHMISTARRLRYVTEYEVALRGCAEQCEFYAFCRGAQAGNRYFEHGSLAVSETTYCRNTRQTLVRAMADHLSERMNG